MNKVIIFFFLLLFTSQSNSSEIDKQKFLGCNNFISEDYLRNYQNYEIEKIEMVGNYAMQITWKDGYDYGIYSWDLLIRLGEYIEVKNNLHSDFDHDH